MCSNSRKQAVSKYWSENPAKRIQYEEIDSKILHRYEGTHPVVVQDWLPAASGVFAANPNHVLTPRERKHRIMLKLEQWLGIRFNKKHYSLVR